MSEMLAALRHGVEWRGGLGGFLLGALTAAVIYGLLELSARRRGR